MRRLALLVAGLALMAGIAATVTGGATFHPSIISAAEQGNASLIAFRRKAIGSPEEIFLMNSDGSDQHRLARGWCFDWSPDGQRLAFLRDAAIYVINVDGTGLRRLRELGGNVLEWNRPRWSPDGGRIAFAEPSSWPFRGGGKGRIIVMNADGMGATALTAPRNGFDAHPVWSPDGRKIVFERTLNAPPPELAENNIWVVRADGSGKKRLTRNNVQTLSPSWSPDGRTIAFEGWTGGDVTNDGRPEIYVMNADGSNQQQVTGTPAAADWNPVWSPSGSRILFLSVKREADNWNTGAIHLIRPDGKRDQSLSQRLSYRLRRANEPAWSPDSRFIAFTSRARGVTNDIYVMTATGHDPKALTNGGTRASSTSPIWSPAKR